MNCLCHKVIPQAASGHVLKALLFEALYRSGVGRAIGWRYRGQGVVFMFHSVVDDPGHYLNDPLRCSPADLEAAVRWARSSGVDIVTMDEAVRRLDTPGSRFFAVFTFDDGYRDNITHALPVMAKYTAPLTIYVTTGMITRQLYAWWDALVALVRDSDAVDVAPMGRRFETAGRRGKAGALRAIKHWIHEDGARADLLRPVFAAHDIDIEALVHVQAMTPDELRDASRHPLVTIGGHTVSHPFLPLVSQERLVHEVSDNKHYLEQATASSIAHFSYPYGAAGQREAECVSKAGFRTAVTTRNGTLFPYHAEIQGLFELPREGVDCSDTVASLDCRSRGVHRFLKSRAGNPIARLAPSAGVLSGGSNAHPR
jgi:peptidoglycan/xylan/chitin deacetylase (PgdA/CDA1 family)